jgi:hypothetical protein
MLRMIPARKRFSADNSAAAVGDRLQIRTELTASDRISIRMASGGGFVIKLIKE